MHEIARLARHAADVEVQTRVSHASQAPAQMEIPRLRSTERLGA